MSNSQLAVLIGAIAFIVFLYAVSDKTNTRDAPKIALFLISIFLVVGGLIAGFMSHG